MVRGQTSEQTPHLLGCGLLEWGEEDVVSNVGVERAGLLVADHGVHRVVCSVHMAHNRGKSP